VALLFLTIAAWLAAPSAAKPQDLRAEFDALRQSFEEAQDTYHAALRALYAGFDFETATAEEEAAVEKKRAEIDATDPSPRFLKEFASLAERAKGTPVAAEALVQVLKLDRSPYTAPDSPARKALATLLGEHIQSPALKELPTILQYARPLDRAARNEAYKKLASDSPVDEVKAGSLFFLAIDLTGDEAPAEDRAQARRMLLDLKARFGALDSPEGKTYSAWTDQFLYELDHLQVGLQAPDFEATDENGVKFKLSDYAGKVVVLDFWGYW
jgi:hypothetical protein